MNSPGGKDIVIALWQNAAMDGKNLRLKRLSKGLKLEQVAQAIGLSTSQISRIERGERQPRQIDVDKMLGLYGQATKSETDLPGKSKSEISAPFAIPEESEQRMPILGVANGGPDGQLIFESEPIEFARTPDYLIGVRGAYAVYVQGESMVPRFKPGERLDIHPHKPARRGDDVVVQLFPETEEGPLEGYVKEYVTKTPTTLVLRQYNPVKEIEIDLRRVKAIHVVEGHRIR